MTGTSRPYRSIVHADQVDVVYPGGKSALSSCSLQIGAGELVVLLGPSGAGKSTLLRCLNGLVTPSAGCVTAAGGDLGDARVLRAHRRATGMIFQQHQLIGRCSVLDNVLTGRLGHAGTWRTLWPWSQLDKTLALRAIERVGLLDRALDRADQLSGGQQQRVGVARALAQQPTLMLADEPVASLDPATAEQLLQLLQGICRSDRVATVVSLHQVDLAQRFADRIVGLRDGRVVFDGPPAALTRQAIDALYGNPAPPSTITPLPLASGALA